MREEDFIKENDFETEVYMKRNSLAKSMMLTDFGTNLNKSNGSPDRSDRAGRKFMNEKRTSDLNTY